LKQQQFQQQFESKNSGYKLDEKSTAYYESLTKKQLQKEADAKRAETIELEKFKKLRDLSIPKSSSLLPLVSSNRIIKKKTQGPPPILKQKFLKIHQKNPKTVSIVGNYSSDDDDD
jgi:hypothetical protein